MFVYWRDTHEHGWELMSGVLLCITGVEAMYADLGHFSRRAVQVQFIPLQGISCSGVYLLNVIFQVDGRPSPTRSLPALAACYGNHGKSEMLLSDVTAGVGARRIWNCDSAR